MDIGSDFGHIEEIEKDTEKGIKKMVKKIKNLKRKTKIIIGAILVVVLIIVGFFIFKEKELPYVLAEVTKGNIVEEISATGEVELAEEVDLRFKTSGIIESINVKVGDPVKKGTYLVRLAGGEVYSQYLQAQASYNQAKAKLDQLLAGATSEEIRVAEQVVENAQIALEDAKTKAENDLTQDYNSALVYLVNSSSQCSKATADLKDMERKYFNDNSSLSKIFREKRAQAENVFLGISHLGIKGAKELTGDAVDSPTYDNIDLALTKIWSAVQKITNALDYTKIAMSDPTLVEDVSSTDKTTIDTDITNINTTFTNINTAQTNIANQKITNQTNINSAESTLKKAEVDMEELKAPPRTVDIAVYQADVDKYRANMNEYSQKLKDASIIAPFDGVVAKIDAKIGEVVGVNDKVIVSLISPGNFQIRADISEADIRKVDISDPVEIVLDAFPEEKWLGRVVEIEPAETIIGGIVYYRVKILFEKAGEGIKSGMTADATIQTNERENALNVPYRSIMFKNDKRFVRVIKEGEIEEREIQTGLKGNKGEIEIISGLKEGDKVITFMKK